MATTTYLDRLLIDGLSGGDPRQLGHGTAVEADTLINLLGDGTDLNVVWRELTDIVADVNAYKGGLAQLLVLSTDRASEPVPQTLTAERFQPAAEFGLPTAVGSDPVLLLGFGFEDYDLPSSFTWKALRSMSFDQVRNAFVRALQADANLILGTVLRRLFSPADEVESQWGHAVKGLWNGTDGLAPLPTNGTTFNTSHSHYLASQGSVLDSEDVEAVMRLVDEHGYGRAPSQRLLLLVNAAEAEIVSTFRAGVVNNNAKTAKFDFVPSALAPPRITNESVIGETPASTYAGLEVLGQYGRALAVQHDQIPQGYIACVATGGPGSATNVIGFREHEQPEWRGLRIIPGLRPGFPLVDSNFMRSFGVGVRHRGAAAVLHVTAGTTYTAPTINI